MDFEQTRSIISAIVLIVVQCASLCGVGLSADDLTIGICAIVSIAVFAYGIWKNHNFTDAAAQAQKYLNGLKAGKND